MEALREPKKLISSHLKELGIPKSVSFFAKVCSSWHLEKGP